MYFLIIATILNIILDLVFVIYFHWGIAGVAIATVISQGATFIAGAIYLHRKHPVISFTFRNYQFDYRIFRKSLEIGLPTGLQQTFVSLGMLALVRIVNDFGTNAIAAYAVVIRIDSFASLPAMNLAAALTTFVGQNIGANKLDRVRRGLSATWKMAAIVSVVVSGMVILFSSSLMSAFTPEPEVIKEGVKYLIVVGAFYIVFSSMFITNGVLRGAGDTLIPMFITLFALWLLRIPISYYLSRPALGLGTVGIWWGVPLAWCFGALASYSYYKTGRWKTKSVFQLSRRNSIP